MREILFRGKTTGVDGHEKDEWVYGNVIFMERDDHTRDAVIFPPNSEIAHGDIWGEFWWVDPKTVGQFTGISDKHGRMLFEDDIVVLSNQRKYPVLVKFSEFGWNCVVLNNNTYMDYRHRLESNSTTYEVIGNVHDNPELLEEMKNYV